MESDKENQKIDYIESGQNQTNNTFNNQITQEDSQIQNMPMSIENFCIVPIDIEVTNGIELNNYFKNNHENSTTVESLKHGFEKKIEEEYLTQMHLFGTMAEPNVKFTFVPLKIYLVTII